MLTFSIIIPTYARPGRVRTCLASLCELDFPRRQFEVIVVDDGSPTPPCDEVETFSDQFDVRLFTRPNGGPGAARNTGAQHARGDYLAFTADDCAPQPDWLAHLAAALARRADALVGGAIEHALPHNACATASHLLIEYLYTYYNRDPDSARFFTPNNMTVPARLFRAVGGFDPRTGATGEDREFCARWRAAGHPMVFARDAVVRHAHPLDLAGYVKQQFAYGVGSARYRKLRATPGQQNGLIPEPLSFYFNLLRYPLTNANAGSIALLHSALLAIGQVANAAGVLVERYRGDPFDAQSARPAMERT